ncbi:MAG: hypothetical protein Sylvanvirus7_29 [Sylvanvirus sp.]|uniref:Uncharacterized protein n=1 Tax=Sylvanvirus sp. TaxID=2487774 RepID=A0A3G5AJN7_9VIRU|nr:MAG: hypothetical protein Sylvanvirus7_29 [Sylvanvirus sp.]
MTSISDSSSFYNNYSPDISIDDGDSEFINCSPSVHSDIFIQMDLKQSEDVANDFSRLFPHIDMSVLKGSLTSRTALSYLETEDILSVLLTALHQHIINIKSNHSFEISSKLPYSLYLFWLYSAGILLPDVRNRSEMVLNPRFVKMLLNIPGILLVHLIQPTEILYYGLLVSVKHGDFSPPAKRSVQKRVQLAIARRKKLLKNKNNIPQTSKTAQDSELHVEPRWRHITTQLLYFKHISDHL